LRGVNLFFSFFRSRPFPCTTAQRGSNLRGAILFLYFCENMLYIHIYFSTFGKAPRLSLLSVKGVRGKKPVIGNQHENNKTE
jgi:hypothetical protein